MTKKACPNQSYFTVACILFLIFITGILPKLAYAQTELNRISAVERSDGKGYVVRFHLSNRVDSTKVLQPSADFIQVKLYSSDLDTADFNPPAPGPVFNEFNLFTLPSGLALDIRVQEDRYFNYSIYPDQNETDQLLALTRTTADELTGVTDGTDPIDWSLFAKSDASGPLEDFSPADLKEQDESNGSTFDVVVIDAGHGGWDPGAGGVNGIHEKDLTLPIAQKVGEYIKKHMPGVKVVYTRENDEYVSLAGRGKIANDNDADLFVSIHANSFSHPNNARQRSVHGAEVYFLGLTSSESALEVMKRENSVLEYENGEIEELTEEDLLIYELKNAGNMSTSQRIAEKIEQQFRERAMRRSRGVKQAGFQVLYEASMPGVLIELGFISNPNEARYLNSEYGQSIVASAIFRSIRDFKLEYDRSYNRQTSLR